MIFISLIISFFFSSFLFSRTLLYHTPPPTATLPLSLPHFVHIDSPSLRSSTSSLRSSIVNFAALVVPPRLLPTLRLQFFCARFARVFFFLWSMFFFACGDFLSLICFGCFLGEHFFYALPPVAFSFPLRGCSSASSFLLSILRSPFASRKPKTRRSSSHLAFSIPAHHSLTARLLRRSSSAYYVARSFLTGSIGLRPYSAPMQLFSIQVFATPSLWSALA